VKVRIMFDKATTRADFFFGLLTQTISLRGDFEQLAKRFKQEGILIIRTDPEIFNDNAWKNNYRPEREDSGVPELFLKVQDIIQNSNYPDSINSVYHRKMMIIDDRVSFIGSINFGKEYLYEEELKVIEGNPRGIPADSKHWHDGILSIRGEEFAKRLNTIFAQQWMVLGGDIFDLPDFPPETDDEPGEDICAIFVSCPGNPVNVTQSLFESVVSFCSGEVIIENPYILSDSFWDTLSRLPPDQAKKIRIITSIKKTDHIFVPASIKNNAEGPWKNGVRFYDYSECGAFSHWKIFVDSAAKTVFHGSTNLNTRSAMHDYEIDLLVKSPVVYTDVKQILEFDINSSRPLDHNDVDGNILHKLVNELTVYFS